MDEIIDGISKRMISRYSERYKKLGYDVRTLGWGTKEQQVTRFEQVIKSEIDFNNKHILDVGCGFGDLAEFLIQKNISFKRYTGWDLNPDLINEARNIWQDIPDVSFDVKNIASPERNKECEADIAVMLGVLNLNFKEELNNNDYSKKLITDTFGIIKDCLIVDFLSTKHNPDYPKEDFVFYHEPSEMLEFAFSLSQNIVLKHNYMPIPQKEFMLFIYK